MNVEQGSFTPLIFTINGGVGSECSAFHKNLAEKIATKTGDQYAKVLTFIRCKLSFIILRSAILCLRGSRSISTKQQTSIDENFAMNHDMAGLRS